MMFNTQTIRGVMLICVALTALGCNSDDEGGEAGTGNAGPWVFEAVLTSPRFLYRSIVPAATDPNTARPIDAYELASRLSYFLWSSEPDDALLIRQLRLIHGFYAQRFGNFVRRMKSATGIDGKSLLDSSVLMFSAGMSDGNAHDANNVAVVVAGGGGGRITPGRVIEVDQPLADLHRTVMELMGVTGPEVENFGDNTGGLPALLG